MATVTQRNGTYKITVSCGYDITGKQIRRSMTWKPAPNMTKKQIEKELNNQMVRFEDKVRNGECLDGKMKLSDFMAIWFKDYAEKELKPKTVEHYKTLSERVGQALGHLKLEAVNRHHIMSFYDNLQEENIRKDIRFRCLIDLKAYRKENKLKKIDISTSAAVSLATLDTMEKGGNVTMQSAEKLCAALGLKMNKTFAPVENKTLSAKTIRLYHAFLSSVFSKAVEWEMIKSNPCALAKPPKLENKEPSSLEQDEVKQMLAALENESIQNRTMVQMLVFIGMRRGELLGLKWSDIDFNNKLISIRRTLHYTPHKGTYTTEPKTKASERVIKLPNTVIDILNTYKAWQSRERLKVGDRWKNENYIFTRFDGSPVNPDYLSGWFKSFVRNNNLPEDTHIHSLRHTNASILISEHTPITTVAKRLGHADATTTAKIYAHAIRSADEAAAEVIDNVFSFNSPCEKTG